MERKQILRTHDDGTPALWTEMRGDTLYLCDDGSAVALEPGEDVEAAAAQWDKDTR